MSRPRHRGPPSGIAAVLAGFVALLALGPANSVLAELRVAVISDLNGSYGSTDYESTVGPAVRGLIALEPDLVLITGDMVAGQRAQPKLSRAEVEAMWASFHTLVSEPIAAAGIPLAITPGNHDASAYAGFALERQIFAEQWQARMPAVDFVDRAGYPFRYAFAVDDVLFVSIDATRVGVLDPAERRWLDELLAREGARFRHRVVFGHLPVYALTEKRETEVLADTRLEQVMAAGGVELYLSGHHHAFYDGFANGIRHVAQACLGAAPRVLIGGDHAAVRAVTLLVLGDDGSTRVDALIAPSLADRLELTSLPPAIASSHGTLVRWDLRAPVAGIGAYTPSYASAATSPDTGSGP